MKKLSVVFLSFLVIVALTGCGGKEKTTSSEKPTLSVSVSFNALYEFAEAVGKDKVTISTIIPPGTEPHDFEPKASDITLLNKAKVLVCNGLGMEPWADEVTKASQNKDLIIITASDGATFIENKDSDEIEEHGQYDPHLWLSLSGAIVEVQNIADGFSKADPENAAFYQSNAAAYIGELSSLLADYKEKFSTLEHKNFVTGHAAFHYFCNDFGLEQNSVENVFAEGEPSSKQLSDLIEYCKEKDVTTIFAENAANAAISETLANEIGASVKTIYTMERPEDDLTYLERMTANCKTIYDSLSQ